MSETYIPLLAALAGAIIGSAASVITILIQSKAQEKREAYKLVIQAAIEDHKACVELAKHVNRGSIMPLTAFIHFHMTYMNLVKKGELSAENLADLKAEQKKLWPSP